ncbi:hypothetical protein ACWEWI_26240 [Streptomyces sp. NPDC003753]
MTSSADLERGPRTAPATLGRDPRDLWPEHARKLHDHLVSEPDPVPFCFIYPGPVPQVGINPPVDTTEEPR